MVYDTVPSRERHWLHGLERDRTERTGQSEDELERGPLFFSDLMHRSKSKMDTANIVYPEYHTTDSTFAETVRDRIRAWLSEITFPQLLSILGDYQNQVTSLKSENRKLREILERIRSSRISSFYLPENYFDEEI
ncbi:MAG: hypothetical protein KAR39_00245 [Thermoplasmata archaeon]|nr:hypothetical protein [Thermoplasmata archaeon]